MLISKCYICPKRPGFNTNQALKYHSHNSIKHSPWAHCKPCSGSFVYESALESRLNAYHGLNKPNPYKINPYREIRCLTTKAAQDAAQFHCCDCGRDFPSESSLDQHLCDKAHDERPKTPPGFFCKSCNRTFCNEHALEQHMDSLRHNPLIEELKCITGSECKNIFTSPSGVLHHLECGACKSGIDRRKLDQLIKEKDTERIITYEAILEEGIQSSDDDDDITEGQQKCPKCPTTRTRTYKTAYALQQHMNSAAHAPLSYHCPATLAAGRKGVLKSFTTFSGMTQHLESGACKGGKQTFVKAVNIVNQKLREHGLGEMKLIS